MRSRSTRDTRSGRSASAVGGRPDPGGSPLARFAGVGLVSTVAYLVLYLLLQGPLLVATGLAGLVRFVLLRAWVFRAHRRSATATPAR